MYENIPKSIFLGFILLGYISVTSGADCLGKPNGVYERACRSFTKCVNGTAIVVQCEKLTAFNSKTGQCEYVYNVPPPCGVFRECLYLPDGSYPDIEQKCMTFYTCINRQNLGHTFCPPGLVFNVRKQVCDWPFRVEAPCGVRL